MKLRKLLLGLSLATIAATSQAGLTIFDGNFGGTAKVGFVETGTSATNNAGEPIGDPIRFDAAPVGFNVSAGISTTTNLAGSSFHISAIDKSFRAYQDLVPNHGGLGAVSIDSIDGDNLSPGNADVNRDEVLFFDFDSLVSLTKVFFNGAHKEMTEASSQSTTDFFNIFTSTDGETYTSIFGGQKAPTDREFLETGLNGSIFTMYAVAASGWSAAKGGYVEALEVSAVNASSPSTVILLGLSLLGLGMFVRKR
jgi:hypothetical protein